MHHRPHETRYYERPGDAIAYGMHHGQQGHHVRVGREPGATVWYVRIRSRGTRA